MTRPQLGRMRTSANTSAKTQGSEDRDNDQIVGFLGPAGAARGGSARDRADEPATAALSAALAPTPPPAQAKPERPTPGPRQLGPQQPERLAAGTPGSVYHTAVELCATLTRDKVLMVGWVFDPSGAVTSLSVLAGAAGNADHQAVVRNYRADILRGFDVLNSPAQCGFVAVATTGGAELPDTAELRFDGPLGPGHMTIPVADVSGDFTGFVEGLALSFDAETRLTIFELIAATGALATLGPLERQRLISAWNRTVAEAPTEIIDPITATRLHVDAAVQLGSYGVLVNGWRNSGRSPIAAVDFVQVGGTRQRASDAWVAMDRPDVTRSLRESGDAAASDEPGFLFIAPVADDVTRQLTYLAATLADGRVRRMRLDPAPSPSDPLAVVKAVLMSFDDNERHLIKLLNAQIGPTVRAIWDARALTTPETVELSFGEQPPDPEVSIIVPIYGRYDFIEFQIALFVDDPAMHRAELIYVIDDPSIYDQARQFCAQIAPIYELPFRVLYQKCNRGFAGANNFGARHARGKKLLLLNSDVFPIAPGWLPALAKTYDSLPDCGALAPKLLYEDGSIQHAGIAFAHYPPWGDMWVNDHPLKGQPDDGEANNGGADGGGAEEPIEFPAVTAACLMIDRELFRQVEGFSEDYIVGDFEDTDLCLRLRQSGRRNWLGPTVKLYHLERQSQAGGAHAPWRANLTLYNCWVHHARWHDTITALAATQGARR